LETLQNLHIEIRLSVQRALLGAVPPSLRAVSIDADDLKIYYRCIFDSETTEKEKELLSVAASEVIADFSAYSIEEEYLVIPKSEKMNHLNHLVFLRNEHRNTENLKLKMDVKNDPF
jgi:hypothetical protein